MDPTILIALISFMTLMLLLTIVALVIYSGAFSDVEVGAGPPPLGPVQVMYKFGRGPYKDCGEIFTQLASLVPDYKTVGIYYDDPNNGKSEAALRWVVSCVVAEGSATPDSTMMATLASHGFKAFSLPESAHAVKASLPHRTFISIFIGIFRVYPKLSYYIEQHKLCAHPFLEIYDGENIHYMAPLARQDEFYVPEALEDGEETSSVGDAAESSRLLTEIAEDDDDLSDCSADTSPERDSPEERGSRSTPDLQMSPAVVTKSKQAEKVAATRSTSAPLPSPGVKVSAPTDGVTFPVISEHHETDKQESQDQDPQTKVQDSGDSSNPTSTINSEAADSKGVNIQDESCDSDVLEQGGSCKDSATASDQPPTQATNLCNISCDSDADFTPTEKKTASC